jgi:hypothetical protein
MMPDTNHLQNDVIPNHIGEVRMVPSVILPHSQIEVTYVLSSKAQQQVLGQYPEENMAIAIPTFSWNRRLFGSALEHRSHQSSLPDVHVSHFDSTDNKAKELLSLMFTGLNDSQKVVARERIRRTYAKQTNGFGHAVPMEKGCLVFAREQILDLEALRGPRMVVKLQRQPR